MLGRITRSITILSPYVQKQRQQFIGINNQFVRLLTQSPALYAGKPVKQEDDDEDILFDLGGKAGKISTTDAPKKSKKPKTNRTKEMKIPKTDVKSTKKEKIPKEKRDRSFEQLKYTDTKLDLTYVKLPFDHPEFQNLMLMLKSRKYRAQHELLLIEGRRLTLEAIEAGLKLKYLLFSHIKQIEMISESIGKACLNDTEIIRVPHNDLSFWSTLTTCPGLITVFKRPTNMQTIWNASQNNTINTTENIQSVPITVICDQVREPNNLGGIIRTCAAVPCTKIILLKGCADPWDVKALRGGCGAQFRVEIVGPIEWETLADHLPAIEDVSVFVADNKIEQNDVILPPRNESDQMRKQHNVNYMNTKVYSDLPFHNCKHIALIVGGETEGVSSSAYDFMKFATDNSKLNDENNDEPLADIRPDNAIIKIPLGNGVESLNASAATAILLFEMRKQIME